MISGDFGISVSDIPPHSHASNHFIGRNTCVCVPMLTHCTITCFGFCTGQIDGIECGLFSNHTPLGQIEVKVTVCVAVCVVECGMMMKGRENVKPSAGS